MRRLIALWAAAFVVATYASVYAPQRSAASSCVDVWNKDHTHILYIRCPTEPDNGDE